MPTLLHLDFFLHLGSGSKSRTAAQAFHDAWRPPTPHAWVAVPGAADLAGTATDREAMR